MQSEGQLGTPSATHGGNWTWPLDTLAQHKTRPKHGSRRRNHRVLETVALGLVGALTFTVTSFGTAAARLTSNVTQVNLNQVITHDRPTRPVQMSEAENVDEFLGQPINILFLGSDSRSGDNVYFAGDDEVEGARADAAIIMHISADRESMAMVSIPRDTIIDIPACPTTTPGRFTNSMSGRRFNEAFAVGYDNGGDILSAAICALTTVEQITNIHLDGFIVLDFLGFTQMVDALGGVGLNVETYIHAPKAGGLHLEPGFQTISGDQALQFARARVGRGLGDGSDLSRIARQQQLLSAIATEALAQNVITDFPRFLRFLDATTSHMTASHNFATVQGLTSLATSLRGVDFENIEFLTAPIKANPADHNTLVFAPDAAELWQVLRYDTFAVSQFASVPDDDSLESAEVSLEAAG